MSSASAPEVVPVATVLEYGREAQNTTPTAGSKTEAGRTRNTELTEAVKKGEPVKSVTKRGSTERHIQPWLTGQDEALEIRLGGVKNPATGKIEFPDPADPTDTEAVENQMLCRGIAEQIDRYSHQLAYTQALTEIRNGRSKADVVKDMQARGVKISEPLYDQWRTDTLNAIKDGMSADALPDGIDPKDIPQWIEDNMVDSTYRNTVMQGLKAQYDKLKDLPDRPTDPDYEAAKQARESAKDTRGKSVDRAVAILSGKGITLDPTVRAQLDKMIENGQSPEDALNYLRAELMSGTSMPHLSELQQHYDNMTQLGILQKTRQEFILRKVDKSFIDDLDKDIARLTNDTNVMKGKLAGDPALGKENNSFVTLADLLSAEIRPQTNTYTSTFAAELGNATKAQRQMTEADNTMKLKEAARAGTDRAWRQERLRAISESTAALENLTDDAMDKVLEAQIGARDRALKTETKLKADEAEKAGKTRLSEAYKSLQKMRDKLGVCRNEDDRRIYVNYEELGADVRFLAYHGEDGIQRLMLNDLMMSGEKIQVNYTRKDGTTGQRAFKWETDDLGSLTEADAKLLEKLMEDHGESYTGRILGDWKLAKSMGGRNGVDGQHNPFANARHLRLKDHEHALLAEHFNTALEAAASKTEEGKKAVDEAKKKGAKGPGLLGILLGIIVGGAVGVKEKAAFK